MSVVVKDTGFAADDWLGDFVTPAQLPANDCDSVALDLGAEAETEQLAGKLGALALIRVTIPSFADGRGFTIARQLRLMGYVGRLRLAGPVIADQYAMARRSGFDEVEISDELAARQTENQWLRRADWRAHDYQSRLRGV
jgi:uncharacterized protein (DUF934 family)